VDTKQLNPIKRYIFSVLFLISLASTAQESTWGVLGGVTLTNYTSSEIMPDANPAIGILLGGYLGIPLNNSLDIEPGLYFSQRRVRYDADASSSPDSFFGRHNLSYLTLPVLLRKRIIDNFSVHAGIYAAGLIHSRYTHTNASNQTKNWESWGIFSGDQNHANSAFDFGGQLGVRYVFSSQFVINAFYERSARRYLRKVVNDGPFRHTANVSVGYQW